MATSVRPSQLPARSAGKGQAVKGQVPIGHLFWEFSHNILLELGKQGVPILPGFLSRTRQPDSVTMGCKFKIY